MRVAQRLYEGIDIGGETVGLITYMRTDGVQIAGEAISAVRHVIARITARSTCRSAAALRNQGEERAGSARGHPPDRSLPAGRARPKAFSIPTRPSSTS
jgi:DNA topoisomerase IA